MPKGPAQHYGTEDRLKAKIGDTPTYDFPVYDGIRVAGWPNGKPVELDDDSVTGWLIVQDPDGLADYTLQGTKVKKSDLETITYDAFRFAIPTGVTGSWTAQNAPFIVEWRDSTGTLVRTVAEGEIEITAKATAA